MEENKPKPNFKIEDTPKPKSMTEDKSRYKQAEKTPKPNKMEDYKQRLNQLKKVSPNPHMKEDNKPKPKLVETNMPKLKSMNTEDSPKPTMMKEDKPKSLREENTPKPNKLEDFKQKLKQLKKVSPNPKLKKDEKPKPKLVEEDKLKLKSIKNGKIKPNIKEEDTKEDSKMEDEKKDAPRTGTKKPIMVNKEPNSTIRKYLIVEPKPKLDKEPTTKINNFNEQQTTQDVQQTTKTKSKDGIVEGNQTTSNSEQRIQYGTTNVNEGRKQENLEKNKPNKELRTIQNQKITSHGTSPRITKRKGRKPKTLHLEDGINTLKEFLELRAKARQNDGSTRSSINGNGTSIHDAAVPSRKHNGEDDLGSETNGKNRE